MNGICCRQKGSWMEVTPAYPKFRLIEQYGIFRLTARFSFCGGNKGVWITPKKIPIPAKETLYVSGRSNDAALLNQGTSLKGGISALILFYLSMRRIRRRSFLLADLNFSIITAGSFIFLYNSWMAPTQIEMYWS